MSIKSVKVGPRSRVLEKREAEQRAADDQALLDAGVPEEIVYPPVPGPSNPSSPRGCGCGKVQLSDGVVAHIDGVEHRYAAPCFSTNGQGGRTYFDFRNRPTTDARLSALEKVVSDLVARLERTP